MDDPIAKTSLSNLANAFEAFVQEYPVLDIGRRIHPADAFALWRTLFRRNPDPVNELPNLLSFVGTYREWFARLANSPEFASATPILPAGYVWMAEIEGLRFWFDTGDREMGLVMAMNRYEPEVLELMKATIRPGMRCIDAGANTGYYTCIMGKMVGPTGKIYAFEPMPSSFLMLKRNVAENDLVAIVDAHELACSRRRMVLEATVLANMFIAGAREAGQKVNMNAVPVDEIVSGPIDILKVDVEGHKIKALTGMTRIIHEHRPVIFSEINQYWLQTCAGTTGKAYLQSLNDLGYRVFNVKQPNIELRAADFSMDILDTMDVIARPEDVASHPRRNWSWRGK